MTLSAQVTLAKSAQLCVLNFPSLTFLTFVLTVGFLGQYIQNIVHETTIPILLPFPLRLSLLGFLFV